MGTDQLPVVLRVVLRCYPRRWRERYGDELCALLDETRVSPKVTLDLLVGAAREWIRAMVRPPGTPIDWRHERRRDLAMAVGGAAVVWAIWISLAEPLRHTWVGTWHSNWKALVAIPFLAPVIRALHVQHRRGNIQRRATRAGLPVPHDDMTAAGISLTEYWVLLVIFVFGRSCMSSDTTRSAMHQLMDFYTLTFTLHMLRMTTRAAHARKVLVDALARRARIGA